MAIQHIATILCDYIIRADNGRLSACGMFRNMYAPSVPVQKAPLGLCVELLGDEDEPFSVTVEGLGLKILVMEDVMPPNEDHMPFQQRSVTIGGELGLQFDDFGVFNVVVRSGDQVVHSTPYGVIQQASAEE